MNRIFSVLFALLGLTAVISAFFGYTHQLILGVGCFILAWVMHRTNKKEAARKP